MKAVNRLYEQRRVAFREYDRAKAAGNEIAMQAAKRKIRKIDADIRKLDK